MLYGFDVGGTKIEFGAFSPSLDRVATERVPTPKENYDQLIETIVALVKKYDKELGCTGQVGLGFPGMERAEDNAVLTVNIPCANGRFFRHDLEQDLNRTVKLENDANCFTLSEAWDKSLQGIPSVMGLILGTGFGGGLVYHGEIFSGRNHVAGEVGHMRVPIDAWMLLGDNPPLLSCGCGKQGCLDNYVSGRGFELIYEHKYGVRKKAIEIIQEYQSGEPQARAYVELFMEFLAACLGNLFTSHDPHVVVLGGGLSNFDLIYEEIPRRIGRYLLPVAKCPEIIRAKYGDAGGVRGAAFLNLT
jgi:N-acetylglucosamine kinase